ncbi:hypothetical protein AMAG_18270 [Allomyces macrogynus ATCC 38327]|uniref:Uncharacterized protein n=1 Tax=Allomyces macrogynus (strain ATCC 38327) TaxID=578462 RepID=A0A0L0S7J9_ALLM3|nr:hypothetical protein AMAG_18270 [Allomyces macrogynus ATCC 38327]|eukprot:KNE58558.1 hypothetical protein AMAG_18270 [Allomyces macrogynus ATCC 38327]
MTAEILFGPIEFAIWQTLTRFGIAAFIVRLVYLAVFLFLAAGLLLLAMVSVVVNIGASTAFSAYQQHRQVRAVWLRPTNATARIAVPMAQYGQLVPRQAANTILQSLIKDKLLGETTWVRAVGTLTESEIMAMRFDDQCAGGDASARVNELDLAVIRGKGLVAVRMGSEAPRASLLGLETRFVTVDWADESGRSSMVLPVPVTRILESAGRLDALSPATAALQQYGVTAAGPFLNGYSAECGLSAADVDLWIKNRTAAPPAFSVAPDLDPLSGTTSSTSRPPSRASNLQYLDYKQVLAIGRSDEDFKAGTVVAVLASLDSARTAKGEFEYLTFGSLTATTKTGLMVTSLLSASDALSTKNNLTANRLATQMALTSISQTCTPSPVSVGFFDANNDLTNQEVSSSFTVGSSRNPYEWALPSADPASQHCRLDVKGLGSTRLLDGNVTQTAAEEMRQSVQYLGGAQVCRVVVRNFKTPANLTSLGSVVAQKSDFVVATQIVQHDVRYRVRCLDQSVLADAAEQLKRDPSKRTEPRPLLTMGLLSRMFGPDTVVEGKFAEDEHNGWAEIQLDMANSGGVVADGSSSYPSWTDPNGPQQYFINAVRVDVWEVVGSLAIIVVLITLSFSRLPSLFDTVIMQLFLYPDLRRRHDPTNGKISRLADVPEDGDLDDALPVEDLTFRATLALIEYPAGMDPLAATSTARPPVAFDVQFFGTTVTTRRASSERLVGQWPVGSVTSVWRWAVALGSTGIQGMG